MRFVKLARSCVYNVGAWADGEMGRGGEQRLVVSCFLAN